MRQITFSTNKGEVQLEMTPQFVEIVRAHMCLEDVSQVTDADLKQYFIASIKKASE